MWTQSPGASCFPRIQWVYMEGSIWAWQQGCIILYIAPGDNKIRCWEASRVTSNSFEASRKLQGYLVQPSTRKVMDIHNLWVFTRQDILYSILTRSVLATFWEFPASGNLPPHNLSSEVSLDLKPVLHGAYIHCPVFCFLIRENIGMFLSPFY